MKNRRAFFKASLAVTAGVVSGHSVLALAKEEPAKEKKATEAHTDTEKHTFPKSIFYTKDSGGKWGKKGGSHLPNVTVEGEKVTVTTKHGMSEKHYIVRHTVVSDAGEVLGEKTFSSSDDDAVSVFEIKGKHKRLHATSFCNKHDLWLTEFSIL